MGRDREPRHCQVDWSNEELSKLDTDRDVLRGDVDYDSTPEHELTSLAESLAGVDSVEKAETIKTRSIDPETVKLWIQIAGEIIKTGGLAFALVTKIVDLIRGRRLKNVKLKMKDATLDVDEATPADIEGFIQKANPTANPST